MPLAIPMDATTTSPTVAPFGSASVSIWVLPIPYDADDANPRDTITAAAAADAGAACWVTAPSIPANDRPTARTPRAPRRLMPLARRFTTVVAFRSCRPVWRVEGKAYAAWCARCQERRPTPSRSLPAGTHTIALLFVRKVQSCLRSVSSPWKMTTHSGLVVHFWFSLALSVAV